MKIPRLTGKGLLIIIIITILITWLLWPLEDDRFAIEVNTAGIAEKKNFLRDLRRRKSTAGKGPNIIIILADDLGKTDISLYGGKTVATPNIDSIGKGGVTFSEAYCSAPVCSPSRASLLTGRYQQRFGFHRQPMTRYPRNRMEMLIAKYFIFTGDWRPDYITSTPREKDIRRQGLPVEEILLPEILSAAGYRTCITGKWHLGHEEAFIPNNRGFHEQYGFYEAFSLYAPVDSPGMVNHRHDYFASRHIWGQGREGTCAIRRNNTVVKEDEYLTFRIAEEANSFIKKNRGRPFFIYVPFSAPHTPFQAPGSYTKRFSHVRDKNKRVYYAMISALDDAVGSILQTLRKENISRETLVFFASDNGGATYTGATENAPLRGGKFSQFEGGLNIPCMMQWPGQIPPGQRCRAPVMLMDFFTTALRAARIVPTGDRIYDGIDLLSLAGKGKRELQNRSLFWKTGYNRAIRRGPYKLIIDDRNGTLLLYDLYRDKVERYNLAGKHPEIIKELMKELQTWERKLKPPLWPGFMNYRFSIDGKDFFFSI